MRLALLATASDALDLEDLKELEAFVPQSAKGSRIYRPVNAAEVAEVISAAAADRVPLLVQGAGTRSHWANPMGRVGAGLSLAGLSGVDEFEPDEGVLKAGAGTRVAEVQALAAAEGWELPLDPPNPQASTVGGTIASAATGPRAHALGSVSDAILGLDLVSAEGVPSKCGGRVVKNVTGYDLAKLHCGAFGTLGVVTSAWLRLRPRPDVLKTLDARLSATAENFALCRSFAKQKSVRALVWEEDETASSTARLVIEWGGSSEGVEHDSAAALAALKPSLAAFSPEDPSASSPLGEDEPEIMDALRDRRAEGISADEVSLRARVLGTQTYSMACRLRNAGLAISVDLGLGVLHGRGRLANPELLLDLRREAEAASGFLFVESMPKDWRGELCAFGAQEETASLMAAMKRRFDPQAILNPGRFIMIDEGKAS